jgi:hypothetical protein
VRYVLDFERGSEDRVIIRKRCAYFHRRRTVVAVGTTWVKKGDGTYEKDSVIRDRNSGCYVLHISERLRAVSKNQNSKTEADADRTSGADAERRETI